MNAFEMRDEILSWLDNVPDKGQWQPDAGTRGVITGLMNSALRLNDGMQEANERRRMVLAWLFRDKLNKPSITNVSAKELSDEMWWALARFIEPHKNQDTGKWEGCDELGDSLVQCLHMMENWEKEIKQQLGFDL